MPQKFNLTSVTVSNVSPIREHSSWVDMFALFFQRYVKNVTSKIKIKFSHFSFIIYIYIRIKTIKWLKQTIHFISIQFN